MPVYNGERFLVEAIQSICGQSYQNWELVIVDDGSTDSSLNLMNSFSDSRVRVVEASRIGLVRALNLGIEASKGKYIARMDSDDASLPDRIRSQVECFDGRPDLGVVSTNVLTMDSSGRVDGALRRGPLDEHQLRRGLRYQRRMAPIVHPSVMMRRDAVDRVGGYRDFVASEDRDLWLRLARHWRFHHVQQDLLMYRTNESGVSKTSRSRQRTSSAMAAVNDLVHDSSGVDLFDDDRDLFEALSRELEARIEAEVTPIETVFSSAKGHVRAGRFVQGTRVAIRGSMAERHLIGPDSARRATARVVSDLAEIGVSRLQMGG